MMLGFYGFFYYLFRVSDYFFYNRKLYDVFFFLIIVILIEMKILDFYIIKILVFVN